MGRQLVFKIKDAEYAFDVNKIDRSKLYGWKEVKAFDAEGQECIKTEIDETGTFMIPKGGKAIAMLDSQGQWVNRSELVAVDADGNEAQQVESSYSGVIELNQTVSCEEFLNHSIDYVYMLENDNVDAALLEEIRNSEQIYTFGYSYRADYDTTPAFILESKNHLFLLTGKKLEFQFLGLSEGGDIDDDVQISEDDDIDFEMM